jgi:tyrosyl-tRNA synthetase
MAELEGRNINQAKEKLAFAATELVHGKSAAQQAEQTAQETFSSDAGLSENLPTITISGEDLANGIPFADLFVEAGLTDSKSEARRLITQGGARANDEPIGDKFADATRDHLDDDGRIKLSRGKKKHALVEVG